MISHTSVQLSELINGRIGGGGSVIVAKPQDAFPAIMYWIEVAINVNCVMHLSMGRGESVALTNGNQSAMTGKVSDFEARIQLARWYDSRGQTGSI